MILAPFREDTNELDRIHPYRYGRILGVYHAIVRHTGPRSRSGGFPQKIEFLWIRWFQDASPDSICSGLSRKRLHAITFVAEDDPHTSAFGFLDPKQVIRGVHLLPAFNHGKTRTLLRVSIARLPSDNDEDWFYYYVNRYVSSIAFVLIQRLIHAYLNSFADRDMFLRYTGGGIGHSLLEIDKPELTLNSSRRYDLPYQEDVLEDVGCREDSDADEIRSDNEDSRELSATSDDDSDRSDVEEI